MTQVYIPVAMVKAIIPFISKDEYPLNIKGFLINEGNIIATNGLVMAVLRPHARFALDESVSFRVPLAVAKSIAKAKDNPKDPTLAMIDTEKQTVTIGGVSEIYYNPGDGSFADYKRAIAGVKNGEYNHKEKRPPEIEGFSFGGKHLNAFSSFGNVLTFVHPKEYLAPTIITGHNDIFTGWGMITPYRNRESFEVLPSWVLNEKESEQ